MENLEMPVFLVAVRDEWVGHKDKVMDAFQAIPCFGDESTAREYAQKMAESLGVIPAALRIVKYTFSGEVIEA